MSDIQAIASAIDGYFDLMYDVDDSRFRDVFADACIVHGIRDGKHTVRSAAGIPRLHPEPSVAGIDEIAAR